MVVGGVAVNLVAGRMLVVALGAVKAPGADVIGAGNAIVTKELAPNVSRVRGGPAGVAAKAVKTSWMLAGK